MSQTEIWKHDIIISRSDASFSTEASCSCGWHMSVAYLSEQKRRRRLDAWIDRHKLDMLVAASHLEFNTHEKKE